MRTNCYKLTANANPSPEVESDKFRTLFECYSTCLNIRVAESRRDVRHFKGVQQVLIPFHLENLYVMFSIDMYTMCTHPTYVSSQLACAKITYPTSSEYKLKV